MTLSTSPEIRRIHSAISSENYFDAFWMLGNLYALKVDDSELRKIDELLSQRIFDGAVESVRILLMLVDSVLKNSKFDLDSLEWGEIITTLSGAWSIKQAAERNHIHVDLPDVPAYVRAFSMHPDPAARKAFIDHLARLRRRFPNPLPDLS